MTLIEPNTGENRKVEIYMNHPAALPGRDVLPIRLAEPGDRARSSRWSATGRWELPYISCAMVAIGMLIHFGITLINFLAKQGIGVVRACRPNGRSLKPRARWHALRYSEGRGCGTSRPSEYLRACHPTLFRLKASSRSLP